MDNDGEEKNQSDSLAMTSCNLKYFYEITMGKGAGEGRGNYGKIKKDSNF